MMVKLWNISIRVLWQAYLFSLIIIAFLWFSNTIWFAKYERHTEKKTTDHYFPEYFQIKTVGSNYSD